MTAQVAFTFSQSIAFLIMHLGQESWILIFWSGEWERMKAIGL